MPPSVVPLCLFVLSPPPPFTSLHFPFQVQQAILASTGTEAAATTNSGSTTTTTTKSSSGSGSSSNLGSKVAHLPHLFDRLCESTARSATGSHKIDFVLVFQHKFKHLVDKVQAQLEATGLSVQQVGVMLMWWWRGVAWRRDCDLTDLAHSFGYFLSTLWLPVALLPVADA
jgi:hypothetical protein